MPQLTRCLSEVVRVAEDAHSPEEFLALHFLWAGISCSASAGGGQSGPEIVVSATAG